MGTEEKQQGRVVYVCPEWPQLTVVRGSETDSPVVLQDTVGAWVGEEVETYVPKSVHDKKLADADFLRIEETRKLRAERDAAETKLAECSAKKAEKR